MRIQNVNKKNLTLLQNPLRFCWYWDSCSHAAKDLRCSGNVCFTWELNDYYEFGGESYRRLENVDFKPYFLTNQALIILYEHSDSVLYTFLNVGAAHLGLCTFFHRIVLIPCSGENLKTINLLYCILYKQKVIWVFSMLAKKCTSYDLWLRFYISTIKIICLFFLPKYKFPNSKRIVDEKKSLEKKQLFRLKRKKQRNE